MPAEHHFSTPQVVYVGSAYGQREAVRSRRPKPSTPSRRGYGDEHGAVATTAPEKAVVALSLTQRLGNEANLYSGVEVNLLPGYGEPQDPTQLGQETTLLPH
jgi:hypothetical protein